MLPTTSSFERIALNRTTFGATDLTVAAVQASGWRAWVEQQLAVPAGDDAALAQHLNTQTLRIKYPAADPAGDGTWTAVDEQRPLKTLSADTATLWTLQRSHDKNDVAYAEVFRVRQELAAATWIRNTHASAQLREFMTDFWHNHFNIGKEQNKYATVVLPVYDRDVIRPNVFGNFRQILEANATSTSMQVYLDNWLSQASQPNENYGREVIELHTLGGAAYLGLSLDATPVVGANGVATGFTDQDVTTNAQALSGWTVKDGQRIPGGRTTVTGEFIYNALQHSTKAATFMGVPLSSLTADMAQGRKVLDILADHSATATFIVTKICKRMFGDAPPAAVIARGVAAWNAAKTASDQIKQVLRAILLDGPEIGTGPAVKIRRPYEVLIALFRTTGMVVNAGATMTSVLDPLKDGLFAWTPPNGRPDANGYWSSTGAQMSTWNLALTFPSRSEITTTMADQTPLTAITSANGIVEYWVGRMVGYQTSSMAALAQDQTGTSGVLAALKTGRTAKIEAAYLRLAALITTTSEFAYR